MPVRSPSGSIRLASDHNSAATVLPSSALSDGVQRSSSRQLTVAFVLAPNFTMLAFAGFVDSLRLAADDADGSRQVHCAWDVVSSDMGPIRASCGILVKPTADLPDPGHYDYVVVVGGLLHVEALSPKLKDYVVKASQRGVPLVGVCTGVFVLAELGLLDGRSSCVSWFHSQEFASRHPFVRVDADSMYVLDEDRLTCAGGVGVIHLAAHLIRKHCGQQRASKAMRILLAQPNVAEMPAQPIPPCYSKSRDVRIRKSIMLMERNLATPLSLSFVAKYVELSLRQLERLFMAELGVTPAHAYMELRLHRAFQLLAQGAEYTRDIALQCGFVNPSHFAGAFRRRFGVTPSRIRDTPSVESLDGTYAPVVLPKQNVPDHM